MRKKSRAREVGKRIATSRFQQGFSQSLVARRAGIDPSYLSRIETRKVHPTVGTAIRLS
jgi:transcriptional regulator with XRE-family HTH domain